MTQPYAKIVKTSDMRKRVDRRTLRRGKNQRKDGTAPEQKFSAETMRRVWRLYLIEVALGYRPTDVAKIERVAAMTNLEPGSVRHILLYHRPWSCTAAEPSAPIHAETGKSREP